MINQKNFESEYRSNNREHINKNFVTDKGGILFMRTTKKITTDLLPATTNIKTNTSTQTPIEIALQIDENGMTTASNLYTFLELEPKNFSHWCLRNIKKINLPLKMRII